MGLEPVLGVWAGLYLDSEVVPQNQLQPYVDDVMNELEFLMVCYVLTCTLGAHVLTIYRSGPNILTTRSSQSLIRLS